MCGFDIMMKQLVLLLLIQFTLTVCCFVLATVLGAGERKLPKKPSFPLSTAPSPHPKELMACSTGTGCSTSLNQTLQKFVSQNRTGRRGTGLIQIICHN